MKKKIGEIELGGKVYFSDPCYGTKVGFFENTLEVIPGKYNVYITRSESLNDFIRDRITNLFIVHKDYYKNFKKMPKGDKKSLSTAVDSGTCGIYDSNYFEKYHTENDVDDNWYDENVIKMDDFKITDGKGAISSSGIGDGCYPVYAEYDKNKAFAIRINYL